MANGNNRKLKKYEDLEKGFEFDGTTPDEMDPTLADLAMPGALTLQERSARQASQRELRNRAIEAGLLSAGTQALAFMPTSIQREQAEQLAELQRQQEAGEAALDPDIRNLMDRAGAAAGRLATQLGQQFESSMAAGGGTSAADIRRVQGEAMSQVAEARRESGMDAATAEFQAREQREQQIESMRAQQLEEEQAKRQALVESIYTFAGELGRVRGESPTEIVNIAAASGQYSPEELLELQRLAQSKITPRASFFERLTFFGGTDQEREPNIDRSLFNRRDRSL
jgi:hypothetical protein